MTTTSTSKSMSISAAGNLRGRKTTEIINFLSAYKPQMENSLPKHLTADRTIQITTDLLGKNEALKDCSVQSLIGAVMQASSLGFEPISALGYCYFVPYKGHIQMQIGYKGYIELAMRSGKLNNIRAHCVYENDVFEYELGLDEKLKHIPSRTAKKLDKEITHTYSVATFKNGTKTFWVIDRDEIESLRLRSPMQKAGSLSGAWSTDYAKMAMAKVVKQHATFLPLRAEERQAIASDMQIITPEHLRDGKYLAENSRPENIDEDGVIVDAEVIEDPIDDVESFLSEDDEAELKEALQGEK